MKHAPDAVLISFDILKYTERKGRERVTDFNGSYGLRTLKLIQHFSKFYTRKRERLRERLRERRRLRKRGELERIITLGRSFPCRLLRSEGDIVR